MDAFWRGATDFYTYISDVTGSESHLKFPDEAAYGPQPLGHVLGSVTGLSDREWQLGRIVEGVNRHILCHPRGTQFGGAC